MNTWINGMHAENPGLSHHWEDWVYHIVGDGGAVTLLDLMFRDGENGYWWERLRQHCTWAVKHIRMYPDADYYFENELRWRGRNWYELRPLDQLNAWIDECIWRLSHVRRKIGEYQWEFLPLEAQPIMDPTVIVSFSNEKDLRVEGHPLGAWYDHINKVNYPYVPKQLYQEAGKYDSVCIELFRQKAPWARCLLGAGNYARGHNFFDAPPGTPAAWLPDDQVYPPDYEHQVAEVRESIEMCDVWLDHGYCFADGWGSTPDKDGYWHALASLRPKRYQQTAQNKAPQMGVDDPGGFCAQYPGKRVMRTETGTGAHSDTSRTAVTLTALDNIRRLLSASGVYVGMTEFLWKAGPEHGGASIEPNEALRNGLKAATRYPRASLPSSPGIPDNSGGDTVAYEFKLAFADYARQHPEIGKATSDISYYYPVNAEGHQLITQWCERGKLEYNEGSQVVGFFPFA